MKFTDIWKHLHVIELHTVFFTIIETTSRKIVIVNLTKAIKNVNMKISNYRKPADEVNKGMSALE